MSSYVGAQPFFNDAVGNAAVQLKAGAGFLHMLRLVNTTAAVAYLQIFDLAAPTVGTTVPKLVIRLAANESLVVPIPKPIALGQAQTLATAGIAMAGTTGAGNAVAAAISVAAAFE
jgi:hypothetical protein